jgi:Uma2 family endonuclease
MPETARRLATWEDLAATPDDGLTYEILDGQLEALPRPQPRHGRAQGQLYSRLSGPFDPGGGGPGGWWLVIEPDVMLASDQIVAPDLVGWRRERRPELPETRPITVVPEWICEVVSADDRGRDRVRKANVYLRTGVPHYWILDPADRSLEAFTAREGAWLRVGAWSDGDTPRIPPFEAVEIEVSSLFPPLPPEGPTTPATG